MYTEDLKITLDFYTTHLGFRVQSYDEKLDWMSLNHNGIELMFTTPDRHWPFGKCMMTRSIYLDVSDVDFWWHKLKNNVYIAYPVETFEYGMRESAFMITMGI